MPRLSDQAINDVKDQGYSIIPNLLSPEELQAALTQLREFAPTPEAFAQSDRRNGFISLETPFGGQTLGLQDIAISDSVVDYAERIIGTRDIRLTQAHVFVKYPGGGEYNQPLHCDYLNNMVDYPRNDGPYTAAVMIVYLSDVDEMHGPTYVASHQVTGDAPVKQALPPDEFPDVYKAETPVVVPAGGALAFGMSTYHRGSTYKATDGYRVSLHLVFRAADNDAVSWSAWAQQLCMAPTWERWVAGMTPRQRELFGFRAPGHPYWNERTINGVQSRYPSMDMTPYREAMVGAGAEPVAAGAGV